MLIDRSRGMEVALFWLGVVALMMAALPARLFARNLGLYRVPGARDEDTGAELSPMGLRGVSLLIPARNEERTIRETVEGALGSVGVDLEVIVLDDASTDRTAEIVGEIAERDGRLRLERAPALPEGWCGKQHACAVLAEVAGGEVLAFLDADVRLEPEGLARAAGFLEESGADLVSGIPRQVTGTFFEGLLIPLVHFVLLGFLPLEGMRASRSPAYGAGCGQLFLARREAYRKAGGHAAIRSTLHDGLLLPRVFRRAGLATDLFDATQTGKCRMYRGAAEVFRGLAKNATEGLGSPRLIVPTTVLLIGGQVLPFVLLPVALGRGDWLAAGVAAAGVLLAYLPRIQSIGRFGHPKLSVVLHPVGVLCLLAIQWYALVNRLVGGRTSWKGRAYSHSEPEIARAGVS